MVATMREMYMAVREADAETRKATVEEIAVTLGKKPRSVVAKLSRETLPDSDESLYVREVKVSKVTGEKAETKEKMAERLVATYSIDANPENIAKMNKTDIAAFFDAFEVRS